MSELNALSFAVRTLSALLGAGGLIGLAGGCFVTNTAHCGYKDGGADNSCPDGFVCSVCAAANNGCVPFSQRESIEASCLDSGGTTSNPQTSTTSTTATTSLPPTSSTTTTETGPTTTTEPSSTTESSSTTDTGTTTETSTTVSPDCDPSMIDGPECAPQYCVAAGQCGPCSALPDGTTCASLDPDKPICDEDSGVCAECTALDSSQCPAGEPICDEGVCVPCTEHSQCPASACDIVEGVCFPDDEQSVFYVQGNDVNCGAKTGTLDSPFCSLAQVPLTAAKTTIRMLANIKPPGQLSISGGEVVAIVSSQSQPRDISGMSKTGPMIDVAGAGTRIYLSRLNFQFAPSATSILFCADFGTLYAHDVKIQGNGTETPRAMEATDCTVRFNRAQIVRNGSGIQVNQGDLEVANSFIIDNGNNPLKFGAFNFIGKAKARITYSTIIRNKAPNGVSTFSCLGNDQEIEVRNSAVLGVTKLYTTGCDAKFTVNLGVVTEAPDNAGVSNLMADWFTPLGDIFPPKNGPGVDPLEGKAMWEPGDPRFDFSGAAIPTDGPSFAGARQP